MTGPEHYRQAERLIAAVTLDDGHLIEDDPNVIALAQVHATLALAAATAELDAFPVGDGVAATGRDSEAAVAWSYVLEPQGGDR